VQWVGNTHPHTSCVGVPPPARPPSRRDTDTDTEDTGGNCVLLFFSPFFSGVRREERQSFGLAVLQCCFDLVVGPRLSDCLSG
jgi:hypothetical protein